MIKAEISALKDMTSDKQKEFAKLERVSLKLVEEVAELQRLPVVTFVAGGIATPADAALLMQLGAEGVFVGSGIFKSKDPAKVAEAIVQATVHFQDSAKLAEVSTGLGELMPGLEISALESRMQERGW
jgi:pyridoxal 5'-phosphate synthase pdxS subunit